MASSFNRFEVRPVTVRRMKLSDLHICKPLQPRGGQLDADTVKDYAARVKAGDQFPPLLAFEVTDKKFKGPALVAGFHRHAAYGQAGVEDVEVEIRTGTYTDAWLAGYLSNIAHGKRYTNEEKRAAVDTALMLFRDKSARSLAEILHVSPTTVSDRRTSLVKVGKLDAPKEVVGKDGISQPTLKQPSNSGVQIGHHDPEPVSQPADAEPDEVEEVTPEPDSGSVDGEGAGEGGTEPAPEPVLVLPTVTDAWGIPVQPHAEEAFAAVPQFKELVSLLQLCQRKFNELANAKGGAFLTLPEVSSYRRGKKQDDGEYADRFVHEGLETCLRQVRNAMPTHTVCPWNYVEAGHPKDCKTCLGQNWTPVLGNNIPESAVAKAKGVFGV